ncbi:hypothetical protein M407DRAFT_75927 [Tulasnella calospora MUT 4182]|uniref:Molybdate-anion transporter n=1 Tax=Tulasnella calospora MUT 4182 TaxID=1051891 RepID=A0A0C3Q703_9AGAM|nr:hypothetical protein M407DRAFT_75927 [Tulasnella calospora MUT 4182]
MLPPYPPPDFYQVQLTVLAVFCAVAIVVERYVGWQKKKASGEANAPKVEERALLDGSASSLVGTGKDVFAALRSNYLLVYGIVMGADWLQGPYVYSLYREQYGYSERVVGFLFVTGFTAAGFSGPFVGVWADKFGRKRICLWFCVAYAFACLCTLSSWIPILFAGRLVSGFATAILFSCFETWVVSASQSAGVSQAGLSTILGDAMLINGIAASVAGVVSNQLVAQVKTFTSPFMLSGVLLVASWFMIRKLWTENYGAQDASVGVGKWDILQLGRLRQAIDIVRRDPALLVLGLRQTCFEGSMYIFVFLWVPSMQEASPPNAQLPLGYIFSAFMVSMMLGSVVYTSVVSHSLPRSDAPLVLHAKLASLNCLVASLALAISFSTSLPQTRFWSFCLFEACVGVYYPVQGMLKGSMISNDHRATLAALFRVPLNIFVTGIMLTGISENRQVVFSACSLVLAFSSLMTTFVIVPRTVTMSENPPLPRPA